MIWTATTALSLCLALVSVTASALEQRIRTGEARDRATGELQYTEVHYEQWDGDTLISGEVLYLRPDGRQFATKRLSYGPDQEMPSFRLEDEETGHLEHARRSGGMLEVGFRRSRAEPEKTANIALDGQVLADAGFDRFIDKNWDALEKGEGLVRPILVPSLLDLLEFRIARVESPEPGSQRTFQLSADSMFLSLFAPVVRVRYDAASRELRRYEGPSNIRDAAGKNLDVVIDYRMSDEVGKVARR